MSLGGGFKYLLYFHLHLGKISILILTSIFFNWGFNHHLGQRVFKPFFPTWPPTFSGHQKKKPPTPFQNGAFRFQGGPQSGDTKRNPSESALKLRWMEFHALQYMLSCCGMQHARVACKGVEHFQNGLNHVYHIYIS